VGDERLTRRRLVSTLGAVGVAGFAGCLSGPSGGRSPETEPVDQRWRTDTTREYTQNHHTLSVAHADGEAVIGVPLSELPDRPGCGLVAVDRSGTICWEHRLPKGVCDPHSIGDVGVGHIRGTAALVVSTIEGETVAYDALTGERLFGADLIETIPYSAPAVTPPLAEGGQRIVVLDNNGNLAVATPDGQLDWRHSADGITYPGPVVGDVDGDGQVEIVVSTDTTTGQVIAFGIEGAERWRTALESGGRGLVGMERDDHQTVAVSTWDGEVVAIDGRTGEKRWADTYAERGILGGYDESTLYTTEGDGVVHAVNREDGSLTWTVDALSTTAPANSPAVGAAGPDGETRVVALSYDGTLGVIDPQTGDLTVEHQFGPEVFSRPVTVDLDDDGRDELVVMFGNGQVGAFSLSGSS